MQVSDPSWLLSSILLLPCLSALAARFVSHNALLLVYFLAAATAFASWIRLRGTFADRFFTLLLGSVALSLILSGTLISNNLSGYDIHQEFALFQQVAQSGVWRPQMALIYNSALSVTILPSIISAVSSLDGTFILKVVYPSVFSIVPMVLYKIYRKMMAPETAFLSVFVFISYPSSYLEIGSLGRQMIAELLFVLLFLVLFSSGLRKAHQGAILNVVLTIALVISHYSLAIVYVSLVVFSYIASRILGLGRAGAIGSFVGVSLISVVISGSWFLFAAGGIALQKASLVASFVYGGLVDFLNPASRPRILLEAMGATPITPGILHLANRITQYLVLICILLGFLIYVRNRRNNPLAGMIPLMIASMTFVLIAVALPYLSRSLDVSRIYDIGLLFISPCFCLGAAKIISGFKWINTNLLGNRIRIGIGGFVPAAILFSYLLLTSGWAFTMTSDRPTSLVLDIDRMAKSPNQSKQLQYYNYYVLQEDVAAARWISSRGATGRLLCADYISRYRVLNSYGGYERIGATLPRCRFGEQYVYLSVMNSITGIGSTTSSFESAISASFRRWSVNDTMGRLFSTNRIYSSEATIYEGFI